jgi:choline kinase
MTTSHIQQVVILAAGMGTRLAPLSQGLPKALFEVRGRPLIDHACDFAESLGSAARIVVGGCGFDALRRHLESARRARLTLVRTADFRAGNLVSLFAALPLLEGDTLVMNVDHLYSDAIRDRVAAVRGGLTIICDTGRSLAADDMKVSRGAGGRLAAISKELPVYDAGYIGMTYVPASQLDGYRRTALAVLTGIGPQSHVERVLQRLADDGQDVRICDLGALPWAEIDTPDDYHAFAAATLPSAP